MGCIYGFFDRSGNVFYVGQTIDLRNRLSSHKAELRNGNKLYCYNKLRKEVRETGGGINDFVRIIKDGVPNDKLDEKEIELIALFRKLGYKLTNLTNGGKGIVGLPVYIHLRGVMNSWHRS